MPTAITHGAVAIALFSPLTDKRYFLPWTPIKVSPLSVKRFLGARGMQVLANEVLWVWLPLFAAIIGSYFFRRKQKA